MVEKEIYIKLNEENKISFFNKIYKNKNSNDLLSVLNSFKDDDMYNKFNSIIEKIIPNYNKNLMKFNEETSHYYLKKVKNLIYLV